MTLNSVNFSVASDAAWAPGVETADAWLAWAAGRVVISDGDEPPVHSLPPMLRRRTGFIAKMALEVAYRCLGNHSHVTTVFSSRHGEACRSVDLLLDLARRSPLSPTSFGLSVHNAVGGLFSMARGNQAANIAVAGGQATVEHAVVEACGLLADGEPAVLLVVYDAPLPDMYSSFQDCHEQPYAWAWLMCPPANEAISLRWSFDSEAGFLPRAQSPSPGLDVLRFYLSRDHRLERIADRQQWLWTRDV